MSGEFTLEGFWLIVLSLWGLIQGIILLCVTIWGTVAGQWKVFEKAGVPGWFSLLPIVNIVKLLQIANRPAWWFFLLCVPVVNIWCCYVLFSQLAKAFGKPESYAVGLFFLAPVFIPILGFGDSVYSLPPAETVK